MPKPKKPPVKQMLPSGPLTPPRGRFIDPDFEPEDEWISAPDVPGDPDEARRSKKTRTADVEDVQEVVRGLEKTDAVKKKLKSGVPILDSTPAPSGTKLNQRREKDVMKMSEVEFDRKMAKLGAKSHRG